MKNRIIKNILVLVMAFFAVPIFAQDAVVVFFNDGNFRKFYLRDIVEISTSQYDEYGTAHSDYQYQHIITKSEKFVYDLSNINSIGFSKYDDAKAEQNFVESMPKVANVLSDCETISDAEAQIDQIKEQQGVEDAWSDGHQLYVKIEEGETFSFHFDHSAKVVGNWMESGGYQIFAKAMLAKAKKADETRKGNLKAVIANQQYYDEKETRVNDRINFQEPLLQAFRDCGIETDYVKKPTVDFFYDNSDDPNNRHIYDYDIILLVTHGAYLEPKYLAQKSSIWSGFYEDVSNYDLKCHAIATAEEIDNLPVKGTYNDKWKECYAKFKDWRDKSQFKNVSDVDLTFEFIKEIRGGEERWIAHPLLTEYFFRHVATGRFPDNSILFNTACQSLLGDGGPDYPSYSFANQLFDKNLSIYIGYTETNFFGAGIMPQFLNRMLNGSSSIGGVFETLPAHYKVESKVNLVNSDYPNKQSVYDDGGPCNAQLLILPDGSDEARKRFLFSVYTNEANQDDVTQEYETDNAVTISCTLTALEPTWVRAGFEYGTDVRNLSQNKNAESYTKIENQGKGNYVFYAKLTGLQPGNTYYYRAYTFDGLNYNYGDSCSFEIKESGGEIVAYTSCPDSHHPHLIDLGLSSGTKWACSNVGASKPENYGRYFAWGETTGKSSYTDDNYLDGKGTSYDIGKNITGTQYDAATANWGSPWVMPNKDQMNELKDKCTSEWITKNGVNGCRFTGPNGASIFLPATGGYWGDDLSSAGSIGVYWSSSLNESQTGKAWYLYFNSGSVDTFYSLRSCGLSVRPVMSDAAPDYPDLQLSETQLSVVKGSSATVEITSGSGEYGVTNLNSSIAKATLQGTTITINVVTEGDAKVVVSDMQTGQQIIIEIMVTGGDIPSYTSCPDSNHPHLIDLGLPSGTKWACCNVGASKPEDYGGYFAWGETTEKSRYYWDTYIHCDGSSSTCHDIGNDIAGTQYDAATANWGSPWVMPSLDQMNELKDNCTSEWTTENGVNGRRFTASNGASIFLPAAGYRGEEDLYDAGWDGYYWSSAPYESRTRSAWILYFLSGNVYTSYYYRYIGHSVRPVRKN